MIPKKLSDFSDKIMRPNKSNDPEKLQTFRIRSCDRNIQREAEIQLEGISASPHAQRQGEIR
jgi:hypothetical protein